MSEQSLALSSTSLLILILVHNFFLTVRTFFTVFIDRFMVSPVSNVKGFPVVQPRQFSSS